jgi:hypothetical protein
MKFNSVSALSSDYDAARRIAFTIAKVADRLGVPLHPYSPESLLQSAMEQPETITPGEYKMIYRISSAAMRSTEAPQ